MPTSEQSQLFLGTPTAAPKPERLKNLAEQIQECRRCELQQHRNKIVSGHGNSDAPPICFIGEAPGETEDRTGVPFTGRAGELLDKMIAAMGLRREDVYIINAVFCRPPFNREPFPEELASCREWVEGSIHAVAPKVIVALGRTAGMYLTPHLKKSQSVAALRGNWHTWHDFPVRVTYHPAGILRNPELKRSAWEDLQEVMQKLEISC